MSFKLSVLLSGKVTIDHRLWSPWTRETSTSAYCHNLNHNWSSHSISDAKEMPTIFVIPLAQSNSKPMFCCYGNNNNAVCHVSSWHRNIVSMHTRMTWTSSMKFCSRQLSCTTIITFPNARRLLPCNACRLISNECRFFLFFVFFSFETLQQRSSGQILQ